MKAPHRLGVRGCALLLCAFIWALVGYGLTRGAGANVPGTFHDDIPEPVRLTIWFAPAVLAVALCRSNRWDWIALATLIIGPVLRCVSYLIAWLLHFEWISRVTHHDGYADGWYSAAIYLALIGLVGIAAVSHRQPYLGGGDTHAGGQS